MVILISGGVKSNKSTYGESLSIKLSKENKRIYVATMIPYDNEDLNRIKLHKENRKNKGFITIEAPTDIDKIVNNDNKDALFFVDSLTALVLNEMFKYENSKSIDEIASIINKELESLISKTKNTIFITDYIFNDYDNYSNFTIDYLKLFSKVLINLSNKSDLVIEMVSSIPKVLKGGSIYEEII